MGARIRIPALIALTAAAVLLLPPDAFAQGCAMCRRNLEANGGEGLLRGFYWSILLLVGTPVALVGTVIALVRRAYRRAATPPAPSLEA